MVGFALECPCQQGTISAEDALDLKKLSKGEMIIGISGIILFFDSFLDWFGAKAGPFKAADNAWGFTLPLFAVLLGIAMVVLVALRAFGVVLPEKVGGFGFRLLYLLGGLAFLLVLLKIIVGPDIGDIPGIDKTREIGAYIGLLCTARPRRRWVHGRQGSRRPRRAPQQAQRRRRRRWGHASGRVGPTHQPKHLQSCDPRLRAGVCLWARVGGPR